MNEYEGTVPPGVYYLGDPCYTIDDDAWQELLVLSDCLNKPGTINGALVLGFGTAYGDGEYKGSDGFDYGVDAGLIGLVSQQAASSEKAAYALVKGLVKLVYFKVPTHVSNKGGRMVFGHISIDTIGPSLDEEDDFEDFEDDEEEEEVD